MLKLIINLPRGMNADVLMTSALALADYKAKHYYKFREAVETDVPNYGEVCLPAYMPSTVIRTSPAKNTVGITEYEVDGYLLDVNLMERLVELQGLIPFEMYFEQRGKYDPNACEGLELGEISDSALERLFNEATA